MGEVEETKAFPQKAVSGRASERYEPVIKTYSEQLEGWKSRNMFQRQWVLRDFKKSTGMSVDEMQNALTGLGTNLAMGSPIERFIEPLNELAAYYEHQKDLLKGFEKNPEKLQKNIVIIDGWINDIKALLEALGK